VSTGHGDACTSRGALRLCSTSSWYSCRSCWSSSLPPAEGRAVLEYIAAHGALYLAELVCFVGLAVPALVVFGALAVAL
jgi:hypothetical protein